MFGTRTLIIGFLYYKLAAAEANSYYYLHLITECPKSLAPQAIIYLNMDITTNAQIDNLGFHNTCVYTEFDLLLSVSKPSWI